MKLHILAIGAHPDDIELSCGGTLIKHAQAGQAVGIVDLSESELSTRGTIPKRYEEADTAAKLMGVVVRHNLKMADGFFRNDPEHQLRLIPYIRHYRPEIVVANALDDRHPDHSRAGRLIADACFYAGLRKIETTWEGVPQEAWRPKRVYHYIQDRHTMPTFICDITDTFEKKLEVIKCYRSQFHDPESNEPLTYIATEDFFHNLRYKDGVLGKRLGVRYGEGFISENVPGVSSLDDLLLPEFP